MYFLDVVASLLALIILEIVLGIDNLVFLTLLTEKLPKTDRQRARKWGLTFAWVTRLLLLYGAFVSTHLTKSLLVIYHISFSFRDIFLFVGGLFLIMKATQEIHQEVSINISQHKSSPKSAKKSFKTIVLQVGLMDMVFSIDSVLTAVGLTHRYGIMIAAITCSILVMIFASEPVGNFVTRHPTMKMLALCFLILIGMLLIADGCHFHTPRGYLYFAMAFSFGVELLNVYKRGVDQKGRAKNVMD